MPMAQIRQLLALSGLQSTCWVQGPSPDLGGLLIEEGVIEHLALHVGVVPLGRARVAL